MTQPSHQRTIGIISPNAIESGVYAPILELIQQSELTLTLVCRRTFTKNDVLSLFREHRESPDFQKFLNVMTGAPSIVLILEGPNAIQRFQELTGSDHNAPNLAESIRGRFTVSDHPLHHALYASTSPAAALHEYQLLFHNTDIARLKASA